MSRIKRFTLTQRLFHLLLLLGFINQAATGLGRMYMETEFGRGLTWIFGGYEAAGMIHRGVGLFIIALFLVHLIYLAVNMVKSPRKFFGPDSLLPRPADLVQAFRHVGWFLGLAKEPRFDRWGYWEKFDYLAVFWGMGVLGITGLLLFDPLASSRLIPGWGLNLVIWIHRLEAMLAMAHLFIIHFFIGHLRRTNFPMDLAIFDGGVDKNKVLSERPVWVERLESQGEITSLIVGKSHLTARIVFYVFGFSVMAGCVYMLVGGIRNAWMITW